MPALLVAPSLAPHDPAATTLARLLRERLPDGWSVLPPVQGAVAARAARRVDGVAFVGGQPFAGRTASTSLGLSLVARARRVRLALVGVGVGHGIGRFGLVAARQVTRAADLLVLRDEASARALVEAGLPAPLRVGSDPAWAALAEQVREPGAADENGAGEKVVVALAPDGSLDGLDGRLRMLAADGLEVEVQPWETETGAASTRGRALLKRLDGRARLREPLRDLADAGRRFAGASVVVAESEHAAFAAAAAGATAVHPAGWSVEELEQALAGGSPRPDVRRHVEAAEDELRLLRLLLAGGDEGVADIGGGTRLEPDPWAQ